MHESIKNVFQSVSVFMFCVSIVCHCHAGDAHLYFGPLTVRTGTHAVSLQQSDLLSNARILTALSGTELESYSYSPFGTRTIRDAMGNEIVESTYGVTLGFGSRPLVKYLNTLDFHHRLYNERNGSFLTRDPLHYIDTHNERQYAMHNPIDFTDYHGLMSQGGQTTAQGAGTGAPVIPPTGNPTGNGEKPNGPDICVNGGAPANNLPWIMQNVQLQSPGEYEKRLREKLDELIKQHGEDIITAHESGALVPWARPPEYVIWLLNGDRPAFQAAISMQSQADLAKALINGRKPKPYEPGGWAFNALGPNGAAYELIAVFAGVTAAPRVFRGSTAPAPTNLPVAFIAPRPRIQPTLSRPRDLPEPSFSTFAMQASQSSSNRTLPQYVFRIDSRDPLVIYSEGGFKARGTDPNPYNQLLGMPTGWISTTQDPIIALRTWGRRGYWLYTIQTPQSTPVRRIADLLDRQELANSQYGQLFIQWLQKHNEWIIWEEIPRSSIIGARQIIKKRRRNVLQEGTFFEFSETD